MFFLNETNNVLAKYHLQRQPYQMLIEKTLILGSLKIAINIESKNEILV